MPARIGVVEFFSKIVGDEVSIIIEGYNHAIPMAAINALLESGRSNLTIFRQSADLISDLLIKHGRVSRGVFGWAGSPLGGELVNLSKASQEGRISIEKLGHPVFSSALIAGSMGLDFIQIPGTSDTKVHNNWRFGGGDNDPICVRSISSDFCIGHAQQIDMNGDALFRGIRGGIEYSSFAARTLFLTVEEEVEELSPLYGDIVVPSELISYFDIVPGGAKPYSLSGYYPRDVEGLKKLSSYLEES